MTATYKVDACGRTPTLKTPSLRAAVARARTCARLSGESRVLRLRGGVWARLFSLGDPIVHCRSSSCTRTTAMLGAVAKKPRGIRWRRVYPGRYEAIADVMVKRWDDAAPVSTRVKYTISHNDWNGPEKWAVEAETLDGRTLIRLTDSIAVSYRIAKEAAEDSLRRGFVHGPFGYHVV